MRAPGNRPRWLHVSRVDGGEFEVLISEAFGEVPGGVDGRGGAGVGIEYKYIVEVDGNECSGILSTRDVFSTNQPDIISKGWVYLHHNRPFFY